MRSKPQDELHKSRCQCQCQCQWYSRIDNILVVSFLLSAFCRPCSITIPADNTQKLMRRGKRTRRTFHFSVLYLPIPPPPPPTLPSPSTRQTCFFFSLFLLYSSFFFCLLYIYKVLFLQFHDGGGDGGSVSVSGPARRLHIQTRKSS